jgi:hypothetical protein
METTPQGVNIGKGCAPHLHHRRLITFRKPPACIIPPGPLRGVVHSPTPAPGPQPDGMGTRNFCKKASSIFLNTSLCTSPLCSSSISADIRVFSLTIRISFSEASAVTSAEALWRTSPVETPWRTGPAASTAVTNTVSGSSTPTGGPMLMCFGEEVGLRRRIPSSPLRPGSCPHQVVTTSVY